MLIALRRARNPNDADREEQPGQDEIGVERVAHDGPPGSRLARRHAADDRREQQHADDLERQHEVVEQDVATSLGGGDAHALAASPQSVAPMARAMTIAMTTEAIAAGTACVWKTSRLGASLVWVSMIANRIRTLIAPM